MYPVMVFTPSKTNTLSGEYPRFARATGSVALVWAIANAAGCTAECKVLLSAPGASAFAVATLPVVEKDDITLALLPGTYICTSARATEENNAIATISFLIMGLSYYRPE
jgi:hypothetical protein